MKSQPLQNKPESTKDSMRNENGQKVKKSESTEETNKNVMETTDTDNSDVENVNINKFGSKKTSRWNRPKIDLSLKDLEKVPTRRSKRIHNLQKEKCQSQVNMYLLLSRFKIMPKSTNNISILYEYSSGSEINSYIYYLATGYRIFCKIFDKEKISFTIPTETFKETS